ncbi:MAG TPA: DUF2905 domain-containing protein [Acidimicrobiia bacterium]|nr:DUF2905 domain-containing protein [Acidimicrobiia bacterium]
MRLSNLLIVIGAGILIVGVVLRFFPSAFSWFGHLPGDIHYQGENTQVFIPITSMLIVSVVGTLIFNLAARMFGER